jgi:biopolymer transport protein ExbD
MAEISNINKGKNNAGIKKPQKKSTRIDLTPMVDLGYLLITFFVFTTTMSMTTALNMNELKDAKPKPVKASGATTILLGKSNTIYYYFGEIENNIIKSNFKEIRNIIVDKKKATPIDKLMFIIKSDSASTFGNAIKIIDEMQICGIAAGHFAEDLPNKKEQLFLKNSL